MRLAAGDDSQASTNELGRLADDIEVGKIACSTSGIYIQTLQGRPVRAVDLPTAPALGGSVEVYRTFLELKGLTRSQSGASVPQRAHGTAALCLVDVGHFASAMGGRPWYRHGTGVRDKAVEPTTDLDCGRRCVGE